MTHTSLAFFQQFLPNITSGNYLAKSSVFGFLGLAIKKFADGFVVLNAQYTPADGSLAEQYHRDNGSPLSAVDLTWSYASALTAFAARVEHHPTSWGATGLVVPKICSAGQRDPTLLATFNIHATTVYGGLSKDSMWKCLP